MHTVTWSYAGPGSRELMDILEARKGDIDALFGGISGFAGYTLTRQLNGGAATAVFADADGAEAAHQALSAWIEANAPDTIQERPERTDSEA